jgi:hypothetical protein
VVSQGDKGMRDEIEKVVHAVGNEGVGAENADHNELGRTNLPEGSSTGEDPNNQMMVMKIQEDELDDEDDAELILSELFVEDEKEVKNDPCHHCGKEVFGKMRMIKIANDDGSLDRLWLCRRCMWKMEHRCGMCKRTFIRKLQRVDYQDVYGWFSTMFCCYKCCSKKLKWCSQCGVPVWDNDCADNKTGRRAGYREGAYLCIHCGYPDNQVT